MILLEAAIRKLCGHNGMATVSNKHSGRLWHLNNVQLAQSLSRKCPPHHYYYHYWPELVVVDKMDRYFQVVF